MDRAGVRDRLREPLRADCAAASSGIGTPQAPGGVAQARPGQTKSLHRHLHCAVEDAARRPSSAVRRRGASPHGARPVGCWAPKEVKVAVDQTSGRDRLNIHGALDLETGKTRMIEVVTVNALSTIALLIAIETLYPAMRIIPVFLDNARYHHA